MDLKLTLKKKWFDMILSGEKTEEYREIKPYWESRLQKLFPAESLGEIYEPIIENVHFFNGNCFSKDLPNFKVKFKGAEVREGKVEWGAKKGLKYYVILLGKVVG